MNRKRPTSIYRDLAIAIPCLLTFVFDASSQSFDCHKASTDIERNICTNKQLGELDQELADRLSKLIAASPALKSSFLSDEQSWLALRDETCSIRDRVPKSKTTSCLVAAYDARISYLAASLAALPGTSSCWKIAGRYRSLANSHLGESPLTALSKADKSGLALAEPVGTVDSPQGSVDALNAWSRSQKTPFAFLADFTKEDVYGRVRIEKLPEKNYYVMSTIEGTAHCYNSKFFSVDRGNAIVQSTPRGFENENGAGCMVSRNFGKLDGAPAFIEEGYLQFASLSSSMKVAIWGDQQFNPACVIEFTYAPLFRQQTLNNWQTACTGDRCDVLGKGAFRLVTEAQAGPLEAKRKMLARLTPNQRKLYTRMEKIAQEDLGESESLDGPSERDPAEFIENAPLLLPYVDQESVYLARINHFTIGWRYFADWQVRIEELIDDKLVQRAAFAIGMVKGHPKAISIRPASKGN